MERDGQVSLPLYKISERLNLFIYLTRPMTANGHHPPKTWEVSGYVDLSNNHVDNLSLSCLGAITT